MSIWTGLRAALAQPLGEALESLWRGLGRRRESLSEGAQESGVAFTIAVIALAAKLAKADGEVKLREVEVFVQLFDVPPDARASVQRFFDIARQSTRGFEVYARDMARLLRDQPALLEDVLDGLFAIALADSVVQDEELAYLARVAEIFGFSEGEFERILANHHQPGNVDPYRVLGLDAGCSDEELRLTYRRLVRENHPDRFIARGLPAELVALANRKLSAINEAYDAIERARKPRRRARTAE